MTITTPAEGFAIIPNWMARAKDVSAMAKLVYVYLASRAGRDGSAIPSHSLIAEEVGISVSSVQRALLELRDYGVVTWAGRSRDGGGQTSNTYFIHTVPQPRSVSVTERPEGETVGQSDRGGRSQGPRGSVSVTDEEEPEEEEPSKKTPPPTPSQPESPAPTPLTETPNSITDMFETFWRAFPKRVGRGRAKAGWEWATTKEDVDPDLLIRQAHGYARLMKQEDRELRYIKSPESWFTARGWEDEYPPAKPEEPWYAVAD